jgi:hypothetical protein
MKRYLCIAALLLIGLCPGARADDAARRAKVGELITVMHMDRLMDQMMAAAKSQLEQAAAQMPGGDSLTPEQKKIMADYEEQSLKLVSDALSWNALQPNFIDLYSKTFTEDEIDGMVAFYKSPAGQAMLTKMPQLMTASMTMVQEKTVALQPRLKELQDQFMKRMANAAPAPAKKPAATVRQ